MRWEPPTSPTPVAPSPGGGGRLAWDLFSGRAHPDVVRLARMMAWCPSDPVDLQETVSDIAGLAVSLGAAYALAACPVVNFTETTESPPIRCTG